MWPDEDEPKQKTGLQPRKLEGLSVGELEDYIAWLNGEITRSREAITQRKASAKAAGSFFKT